MLPEAPALLSMTTGWPSARDSGSAMVRAAISGVEPPGKPTRMRTGLVGQACCASALAEGSKLPAARPRAERRRVLLMLLLVRMWCWLVVLSVKADVSPL